VRRETWGCRRGCWGEAVMIRSSGSAQSTGDLFRAAKSGDLGLAREAIRAGADVDYLGCDNTHGWAGYDPIEVAARFGHLEIVRELLKIGVRDQIWGKQAIIRGFPGVVREWLRAVPDAARQVYEDYETPLMTAACCDSTEILKMLIDAGADPNAIDNDGRSALHIAIEMGKTDNAELLWPITSPEVRRCAKNRQPVIVSREPTVSDEADAMLAQFKRLVLSQGGKRTTAGKRKKRKARSKPDTASPSIAPNRSPKRRAPAARSDSEASSARRGRRR
jgi:hypothetical protein